MSITVPKDRTSGKNLIQLMPIIQTAFENCRIQEQKTGWMESNAKPDMMQWISGRDVMIRSIDVDGFGDYPATCEAFPSGGFSMDNKVFTLGFRRAVSFCWDRAENGDTDGVVNASNILSVFRKKQVIPEVDAYRFSKLAQYAIGHGNVSDGNVYTDPADTLKDLRRDILAITNEGLWQNSELMIFMDLPLKESVVNLISGNNCCFIDGQGNLRNAVNSIDGVPIETVYSKAFRTLYKFHNGFDGEFGFSADSAGKQINWIIVPRSVPTAIVRYDLWKAFTPDQDQDGDSFKLLCSMYHDLWVNHCDLPSLFVNTQ